MITLRSDQTIVLDDVRKSYRQHKAVLLRASTGWGKTVLAREVCRAALGKSRRVIFSTPRVEINAQAERTFAGMDIRIACKQALVRQDWNCDLLIDDEAHYGLSDAWANRLNEHVLGGGWVMGLTATPIPGMDRVYQKVVHGPSPEWLMEQGHLSKYRAFGPSEPDVSKIPYGTDFAKAPLEDLMDKPSVTGNAADSWLKFAKGLRTVGYCVSRKHSRNTVDHLRSYGIRAEHIDGETPEKERRAIIERFADRETEWLSSVGLLTMGFDLSSQIGRDCPIEAMQDLAPTRSLPNHIQKLGRALRKKDRPAVLIDNAGNLRRMGFPDDDYEWSIVTGTRRKPSSALAVSICHVCFAAFRTSAACPYCETERKLTPREIEEREGELAEIERQREMRGKRISAAIATRADDPVTELSRVAKANKYKAGWVIARLKAKKIPFDQNTVWRKIHAVMNAP